MASREMRRIRERLTGKGAKDEREKKPNKLAFPSLFIIGLVLLGLIWWGSSSQTSGQVSVTFGAYDGRPIVWSPFNYFAQKIAEVKSFNESITNEEAVELLLPYMTFHTAALVEAERNGLFVSDAAVEEYITDIGAKERYNKVESMERHELFNRYKEELIELKFVQSLANAYDNPGLAELVTKMGGDEKKFRFVGWKYDDYPRQETIRFADENKDLFRRIKLSRLAVKSESEAYDVRAKIVGNQSTFDEQLKASATPGSEASAALDWQSFHALETAAGDKEKTEAVFALKQGEISDVVKVGSEWIIYRCDQEVVPADLSAEKTQNEVKQYILDNQKGRVETYFETQAKEFVSAAQKSGFAAAARAAGLKANETGYFPLNYNVLPFLKEVPKMEGESASFSGVQYERSFFTEAFALKKGETSKPILLQDVVIVCELADMRQPLPQDRDDIKRQFDRFRSLYIMDFFYVITDRLYVLGAPLLNYYQPIASADYHTLLLQGELRKYQGLLNYDMSRMSYAISQHPFYRAVVDQEKLGSAAEQAEREARGLEEFRALFAPVPE